MYGMHSLLKKKIKQIYVTRDIRPNVFRIIFVAFRLETCFYFHIYGIIDTHKNKRIRPDAFCYHGVYMPIKLYGTFYTMNTNHIRHVNNTWSHVAPRGKLTRSQIITKPRRHPLSNQIALRFIMDSMVF
jgi:hypothetical protein